MSAKFGRICYSHGDIFIFVIVTIEKLAKEINSTAHFRHLRLLHYCQM